MASNSSRTQRRGPWSQEEDRLLLELVDTQGPSNWVRISQSIRNRTPKQCRERFHQNLKPNLNHNPISHEEGAFIEAEVARIGKRWAEIARRMHGRSDNAVKNWWNGGVNRRKRMSQQQSQRGVHHYSHATHYGGARYHPYQHHTSHQMPPSRFGPHATQSFGPSHPTDRYPPTPFSPHAPSHPEQRLAYPSTLEHQPNGYQPVSLPRPQHDESLPYPHIRPLEVGGHHAQRLSGGRFETPLPSPSNLSTTSSGEVAPDLVSDTSEARTPFDSNSPVELPPFIGRRDERRNSTVHYLSHGSLTDDKYYDDPAAGHRHLAPLHGYSLQQHRERIPDFKEPNYNQPAAYPTSSYYDSAGSVARRSSSSVGGSPLAYLAPQVPRVSTYESNSAVQTSRLSSDPHSHPTTSGPLHRPSDIKVQTSHSAPSSQLPTPTGPLPSPSAKDDRMSLSKITE